jgi:quinol monooxygenase YgiN
MITITAVIRVKPGHEAAMRAALLDVAAFVAANEPGTVGYFISQPPDRPELFTTYERFADRAAMDRHNDSPAVARFIAAAKGMLAEPFAVHIGTELSAHQR